MSNNSKFQIPNFKLKQLLAITALLLVTSLLAGQSMYPQPASEYVNDFANIIDSSDKTRLHEMLKQLEYTTGIEMTVVTVRSIGEYPTGDASIESFATGLFNDWGVGHKKENNGVMILVAYRDRQLRIELGKGYGYQYDAVMKDIIDNTMVPYFREGQISRGIYEGTSAVIGKITKKVSFWEYYWPHILIGALIIVFILAAINMFRQGKTGWGYAFLAAAGILIIILLKMLASGKSTRGFGGGSSFGGGASGSW